MAGPSGALFARAVVETWLLVLLIHPAYIRSRSGLPLIRAHAACRVSLSPSEVLDPEAACLLSVGQITYQQPPSQGGRQPKETAGNILLKMELDSQDCVGDSSVVRAAQQHLCALLCVRKWLMLV